MTAQDLFNEGRLTEAIAEQGKLSRPEDRALLCDMLGFAGDFAAIREELKTLPGSRWADFLDAAEMRLNLWKGQRPDFPAGSPEFMKLRFDAIEAIRLGKPQQARDLLDDAEETTPELSGYLDGVEFQGITDADDFFGPVVEAFIENRYCWIPFAEVRRIRLGEAETAGEFLYVSATLTLRDARSFPVFLPSLYADSHLHPEEPIRMGHETDWEATSADIATCKGLRIWMIGSDEFALWDWKQLDIGGR